MSEAKTVTVLTQDLMNAQVGVLGSMLIDEECVGFVLSRVSERDFVTQQYRSIFRAIRTLFREGLPTDAIAVREKLGGKLGDGWSKLLTGIMDYPPSGGYAGCARRRYPVCIPELRTPGRIRGNEPPAGGGRKKEWRMTS